MRPSEGQPLCSAILTDVSARSIHHSKGSSSASCKVPPAAATIVSCRKLLSGMLAGPLRFRPPVALFSLEPWLW
jgi:hypothetical protein